MNFSDSEDGRVFTAARLSSDQVVTQLNHLQAGYEGVNQIVLERIELNQRVARSLTSLLQSDKHSWISIKFVDCRQILDEAEITALSRFIVVPRLFLQTTPNYPTNVDCFFPIESVSRVKSIRICTHSFTEDMARRLSDGLVQTSTLEELSLSGSRRVGSMITILAQGMRENKSLRCLDLGDCQLHDSPMYELLTSLKGHPNLQKLDLSNNLLADQALQALTDSLLPNNKCLQMLDVSLQRNRLKMSILAPALANPATSLKQFYASNCRLEDEDVIVLVDALVENSALRDLDLSNNRQVTDAALIYLAARLPEIKLNHLNLRKMKIKGSLPVMKALHEGMRRNTSLLLLRIYYWKHVQYAEQIQYFVNANRGGRQVLGESIPLGLWPLVFQRAHNQLYYCPLGQHAKVDAVYHLFRNASALWE
jgi:hypothetical protein